jgi:hypothetical protein
MVAAINLALPKLSGSSLEPTSTQLLWIVDANILVIGGLLVVAGSLADRFNARELGSTVHTQTLTAFTDAMALGFRCRRRHRPRQRDRRRRWNAQQTNGSDAHWLAVG